MSVRKIIQAATMVGYLALASCFGVAVIGVCNVHSAVAENVSASQVNVKDNTATVASALPLAESFLQAFGLSNAQANLGANSLGAATYSFTFVNNIWTVSTNFTPYTYQYQGGSFVRVKN